MGTARLAALTGFAALAACAASPVAGSAVNGTCAEQYQRCSRTPGDRSYCDDQRDVCEAQRAATIEERSAKERGYEEFLREREDAE